MLLMLCVYGLYHDDVKEPHLLLCCLAMYGFCTLKCSLEMTQAPLQHNTGSNRCGTSRTLKHKVKL